jgi:hypothetical protein
MAQQAGKVYGSADEMIAGVSKETGVPADQVRKVIRASFSSTKDFVLQEIAKARAEEESGKGKAKGAALSDKDLDGVAGGIIIVGGATPGYDSFSKYFSTSPYLLQKIGSLGP